MFYALYHDTAAVDQEEEEASKAPQPQQDSANSEDVEMEEAQADEPVLPDVPTKDRFPEFLDKMNEFRKKKRVEYCSLSDLESGLSGFAKSELLRYLEQMQEEGFIHFADDTVNFI